ncbi:MAG: hypothetical protein ABI054_08355, partial [Planctomycetota bacterium]
MPCARADRRAPWIAAIFFAAASLVFLWPAFVHFEEASYTSADLSQGASLTTLDAPLHGGNPALSDPVLEMLPWLLFNRAELREGRLPTWNPWNGAGLPHLANGQSAVLSPFSLPFYFLPLKWALIASAFLKLFSLGYFTFLLLGTLGASPLAGAAAGVIFEFGGHNVLLLAYPHAGVAAAFPAALWVIERAWQALEAASASLSRSLIPWVCALALVFATALFAGSPETAAFVVGASGIYALARAISFALDHPARRVQAMAALVWLAIGGLLGLAIAAIQVLPFLEYAAHSTLIQSRSSGFDGLRSANWPLQFFPDLFGNPAARYSPRVDLPYPNYEAANTSYFGPLTWLLALVGAVLARGRFAARFFAVLTIVWVLAAFDFRAMRPVMVAFTALTHAPMNRSQFVPLLALAALAAFAVDALRPKESGARWAAFALICVLAGGMIFAAHQGAAELVQRSFAGVVPRGQGVWVPVHLRSVTWIFCLGALVFASFALLRAAWMRKALALALLSFLFAQSAWLLRGFNPLSLDEHVFPRTPALQTIAAATGRSRVQVIGEDTLTPQMNMVYEIACVSVYDALNVGEYDRLYQTLFSSHGNWRETLQTSRHALQTLGIEYLLAREEWPRVDPGIAIDLGTPMRRPMELLLPALEEPIQTFRVAQAGFDRLQLALGAKDDPIPAFLDVILEDVASGELVAMRRLDTHSLRGGMSTKPRSLFAHDLRFSAPTAWVQLAFEPRADSAGHTYRLRLSAPTGKWKNGFIAWTVDNESGAAEPCSLRMGDLELPA